MTDDIRIHRGLKGVHFERSGISDIDGRAGKLTYRGYSIHDLAEHSTFEETAYLLIHGELPDATQLAAFTETLVAARTLPQEVLSLIDLIKDGHPMDVLRTAVSALAALEAGSTDTSEAGYVANGLRLTSQVPQIVATHHALRTGRAAPKPDPSLGHAANWLWMLKGEKPS
ncbi:MAG: citrate/2-methylcitrate synthase, partial [Pseudomonadota bacterium]